MAAKKESTIPADKLTLYIKLVATIPETELKGVTMPYTSYNGNMFSYLNPEGILALRLSAEDREAFMKKYKTSLMEAHGIIQKEYVSVPDKLLKKTAELKKYFGLSYAYVQTLKPKPTKKK